MASVGNKMLPSPLRPLVPVSALALLGWCWFTFRKRRISVRVKQENEAADHLAGNNTDVDFRSEFQKKQEDVPSDSSPSTDQDPRVGSVRARDGTSTPIVRLRPEPEGEVSQRDESSSVVEEPEMETEIITAMFEDDSDTQTNEKRPPAEKPDWTDTIQGFTDPILEVKDQQESEETQHKESEIQNHVGKMESLLITDITGPVGGSTAVCLTGDDSGYSNDCSDDGADAARAFHPPSGSDTHELKHWGVRSNEEPLMRQSESLKGSFRFFYLYKHL